jgi:carbon-monoxide dehydrogenase large subunit
VNPQNLRFGSGQAVRRLEDEQLLKGAGVYTDDVSLPGQTRLCFVRSPYPHARIVSIDTSAAKAMPGVHLVVTGAELKAHGAPRQLQTCRRQPAGLTRSPHPGG